MFIRLTNGTPETYTIGQLRRDNPNVSFPKDVPAEVLESYGVYSVNVLPRPGCDPLTHYLKQSDFYQVDGKWQCHYFPEPIPEAQAASNVRAERDSRLAATDWMVMPDSPRDSPELRERRQALRDIPQQDGFPFDVTWPE
jgi:hypothetical protein